MSINRLPEVDHFLNDAKQWQEEMGLLREIVLKEDLEEVFKWNKPCYAYEDKNVVIIQGFKAYVALLFFKGMLIEDVHKLLILTGENTEVGRQLRFSSVKEIKDKEDKILEYIRLAIEVEKAGLKLPKKKPSPMEIPEELQAFFDEDQAFKDAFFALTPGRQKGYIIHFTGAKQVQTRISRIEKCIPMIFDGIGLNDR